MLKVVDLGAVLATKIHFPPPPRPLRPQSEGTCEFFTGTFTIAPGGRAGTQPSGTFGDSRQELKNWAISLANAIDGSADLKRHVRRMCGDQRRRYDLFVKKRYTVSDGKLVLTLERAAEGGYVVTSPLDPELVTEAETVEEAFLHAQDALKALRESRIKLLRRSRTA